MHAGWNTFKMLKGDILDDIVFSNKYCDDNTLN
jgi:hypothetical protein